MSEVLLNGMPFDDYLERYKIFEKTMQFMMEYLKNWYDDDPEDFQKEMRADYRTLAETYQFMAFAQRDTSGGFIWTSPPEWLRLPEGPVRFLSPSELNQDWRGLCGELSPEELEQIRYWSPQTVGEIIFNTWD